MKVYNLEDRGLSPMVATIVLIGLVMVIAGVLAAGISGGTPTAPKSARVSVDGLSPGTSTITISHNGGDDLLEAWKIVDNSTDNDFVSKNVDIRLSGESFENENVELLTSEGSVADNDTVSSFVVGDVLKFNNLSNIESGDSLSVVWLPNNQKLLSTEV